MAEGLNAKMVYNTVEEQVTVKQKNLMLIIQVSQRRETSEKPQQTVQFWKRKNEVLLLKLYSIIGGAELSINLNVYLVWKSMGNSMRHNKQKVLLHRNKTAYRIWSTTVVSCAKRKMMRPEGI